MNCFNVDLGDMNVVWKFLCVFIFYDLDMVVFFFFKYKIKYLCVWYLLMNIRLVVCLNRFCFWWILSYLGYRCI